MTNVIVIDAIDRPIDVGDYLIFMVGAGTSVRIGKVLEIKIGKLQTNYWNQNGYQTVKIKTSGLAVYSLGPVAIPTAGAPVSRRLTSSWEAGRIDPLTTIVKATSALLCVDPELIQAFEDTP